jgi:hypothetical protein
VKRFTPVLAAVFMGLATSSTMSAPDCKGGYKAFLATVSPYIEQVDDADLPTLMRQGLSVFEACTAGDMFSPGETWDQIAADMQKKLKK